MPSLEDARILQPVTAATLDTLDLFYVYGAGVNDPLKLTVPEFRKTLFNVAGEAPVNAAAGVCTLDPTGADNTVTLTLDTLGATTATGVITTPASAAITFTLAGTVYTIAAGAKHRMVISGTTSPDANQTLIPAGEINGFPAWSTDGSDTAGVGSWTLLSKSTSYQVSHFSSGVLDGSWTATEDDEFPDGLTFEADDTETGAPVVTASPPTAAQVVAAVNDADIGVTASGSGSGAVAAKSSTAFTGGVDATTSSSFVIATTTTLYVNVGTYAAPVWKEAALSALS